MATFFRVSASLLIVCAAMASAAAQQFEVKRYNPSPWTKGRFSEVVTVTGPGKIIYLAGIGAEDDRHPGPERPDLACRRSFRAVPLRLRQDQTPARHARRHLGHVVKHGLCHRCPLPKPVRKCRDEAYGKSPIPANTFLVINGLASPTMLLEIDITAVVRE